MSPARLGLGTLLALVAFAANSLLCRAALDRTAIDPATFTGVRLVSGAVALLILVAVQRGRSQRGTWRGGVALFAYAATFDPLLTLTITTPELQDVLGLDRIVHGVLAVICLILAVEVVTHLWRLIRGESAQTEVS